MKLEAKPFVPFIPAAAKVEEKPKEEIKEEPAKSKYNFNMNASFTPST